MSLFKPPDERRCASPQTRPVWMSPPPGRRGDLGHLWPLVRLHALDVLIIQNGLARLAARMTRKVKVEGGPRFKG